MIAQKILRPIRLFHLYCGVFISPAVLFFALSGAMQTLGLHEFGGQHPGYTPAKWILKLAQIHKHQTVEQMFRRPPAPPLGAAPTDNKGPNAAPSPNEPIPLKRSRVPLQVFFLVVSLGLFSSTLTGLYMSWRYTRPKKLLLLSLIGGIVLPVIFLLV